MKPLDIVKTPQGGLAVITETDGHIASIDYIHGQNPGRERNAWWVRKDLRVVDSIPRILANGMAHPFGRHKHQGDLVFGPDHYTERCKLCNKPLPDDWDHVTCEDCRDAGKLL